jgi:2,5-diamino-6-(ribosylamino)-4(3H)-pyrimidinone 5'-phosphate reductase
MVGVGTVLADDPGPEGQGPSPQEGEVGRGLPEEPLRVVVDSRGRTPPSAEVLGEGCIIADRGPPLKSGMPP